MSVEGPTLDPLGAAFFPDLGALAVSDLHVGYESAHRSAGTALPRAEVESLLPLLDALVDRHRPDVLVVTGDVKHGFGRTLVEEAQALRFVHERMSKRVPRVVLLEGNHDVGLARILPHAEIAPWLRLGETLFAHGHARPPREAFRGARGVVVGHEHPALTVTDEIGAGVRVRAFLRDKPPRGREALVLPALSPWAAGYDVASRGAFLGPLLAPRPRDRFRALALAGDEVLDFGEIGRLRRALARRSA